MEMEQALYRKYRPRDFKSAVAQDHIVKTLEKAIKSGRISHAYLFTGPRGVGKTSIARILAHEINGLPYDDDSIHLDIIEIDAASNRRIDEIRDLRDRVRIAPASAKYKVYIIDEVHMLTREAFNALLKTLEEPPAHCVFILATTEAHKLPYTIISRTQRFEFKPVNPVKMAEHLGTIAKQEKIDITSGALELLAKSGEGSFRDSIGYLDQLSAEGGKIDEETVRRLLGLPSKDEVLGLVRAMGSGDVQAVAQRLESIQHQGINAAELAAGISDALREKLVSGETDGSYTGLLKDLLEVKSSARPQELLEITVLDFTANRTQDGLGPPAGGESGSSRQTGKDDAEDVGKKQSAAANITPRAAFDLAQWDKVVVTARDRAASIYTALRLAEPLLEGDRLVLQFGFPLHQKKLDQAKNKLLVSQIIDELFGRKLDIECVVNKDLKRQPQPAAGAQDDSAIHSISNIFGTAEMLET